MYIKSICVKNFRLLKDSILHLNDKEKQKLSLLIGKNNSGKTSFIVLFDKFFRPEKYKFKFTDFPICLRKDILNPCQDLEHCSIQMKMEIQYCEEDNLENLSEFILDLDPKVCTTKLLFECTINKEKLNADLANIKEDTYKKKYIERNLSTYLEHSIYIYTKEEDLLKENRSRIIKKELTDIKKIINYQVIHAKREVASSEYHGNGKTALSELANSYFNKEHAFARDAFNSINDTILRMDEQLNEEYKKHFRSYFNTVKHFIDGGCGELNVISNLESKEILSNHSKVVYGDSDTYLPETLNGLGHLNILFLLLQIEVKKLFFEQEKKDINILFIEEPEAHTHPQMQYIFIKTIKDNVLEQIVNLQTFITTHSSHIVSQCDFKDIRYFKLEQENVSIKNFHQELEVKYSSETEHFKFIKQYLTLYSSELFFAERIIIIEGVTERILLPHFIKQYDKKRKGEEGYIPLTSRNISFIEAGTNAKVFSHFLEFLDIRTLIITDLDGTKIGKNIKNNSCWEKCCMDNAVNTRNYTIKHYLNAPETPDIKDWNPTNGELEKYKEWFNDLKENKCNSISDNIKVSYQIRENGYHACSFEDSFLSVNLPLICEHKENIKGLQRKDEISFVRRDYFNLTNTVIKNSDKAIFASSILFLALVKGIEWNTPEYIMEGLNWIAE